MKSYIGQIFRSPRRKHKNTHQYTRLQTISAGGAVFLKPIIELAVNCKVKRRLVSNSRSFWDNSIDISP